MDVGVFGPKKVRVVVGDEGEIQCLGEPAHERVEAILLGCAVTLELQEEPRLPLAPPILRSRRR